MPGRGPRHLAAALLVLTACGGAVSVISPAPTPAPPPPAPVPPPSSGTGARTSGLGVTVAGHAITLVDGDRTATLTVDGEPLEAATVPLTVDGVERAAWVIVRRGDDTAGSTEGMLVRLDAGGAAVVLRAPFGAWQRYLGGGSAAGRLLDLDGDGRYELVLWSQFGDDTGIHTSRTVYAWTGAAFAERPALVARAPETSYRARFPGRFDAVPIAQAIGAAQVAPMAVVDLVDLPADAAPDLGAAPALAVGPDVVYLAFVPDGARPLVGRFVVAVVHAYVPSPSVIAWLEVGRIDLPDDARSCGDGAGEPWIRHAADAVAPTTDFDVAWQATPGQRTRRTVRWAGGALTLVGAPTTTRCR